MISAKERIIMNERLIKELKDYYKIDKAHLDYLINLNCGIVPYAYRFSCLTTYDYYVPDCIKIISGIEERIKAEELQLNILYNINNDLKNIRNDVHYNNTYYEEEINYIKKYLNVAQYYGSNKRKVVKMYSENRLIKHMHKKGFDTQSIYCMFSYLKDTGVLKDNKILKKKKNA